VQGIDLSGISRVAVRDFVWQLLALGVGSIFLAIALSAGRPWSPAGVIGMVIVALAVSSLLMEWRAGRGWRLLADEESLTLQKPDRTKVRVAAAEIRSAQRVAREVQELHFPKLNRGLSARRNALGEIERTMAATQRSHLSSFLLIHPEPGAQWIQDPALAEIKQGHGVEIPITDQINDARLKSFFAELGVSYIGK